VARLWWAWQGWHPLGSAAPGEVMKPLRAGFLSPPGRAPSALASGAARLTPGWWTRSASRIIRYRGENSWGRSRPPPPLVSIPCRAASALSAAGVAARSRATHE
jgi:hypothetical protein